MEPQFLESARFINLLLYLLMGPVQNVGQVQHDLGQWKRKRFTSQKPDAAILWFQTLLTCTHYDCPAKIWVHSTLHIIRGESGFPCISKRIRQTNIWRADLAAFGNTVIVWPYITRTGWLVGSFNLWYHMTDTSPFCDIMSPFWHAMLPCTPTAARQVKRSSSSALDADFQKVVLKVL